MTDEPALIDPSGDNRLGRLRPKDTSLAKSRSASYSRAVVHLRRWLMGAALVGLVSLIVWPMWKARDLTTMAVQAVPNLMVDHLHLTGLDRQNQAYSVTAERALQVADSQKKGLVDLEKPQGEIALNSGAWLSGRAAYGRLDQNEQKLWLGGGAEFFHDQGYRLLTDEMDVDMKSNTAWGQKPVLIQGNFGEIRGTGFRFLEGGKAFIVTGPATARLDLRRGGSSDKLSGKE